MTRTEAMYLARVIIEHSNVENATVGRYSPFVTKKDAEFIELSRKIEREREMADRGLLPLEIKS